MKSIYILLLAAAFATACDNNINGSNEVKATVPVATPQTFPLTDTSKKATIAQPTLTTNSATATNPVASTNPPHGQPGHVCGPTGGAPISVSPSANATSTTPIMQPSANQPLQNSSAAQTPSLQLGTSNAKAGARLNPAHGQPGHDCNIEVGKPLKQ